MQMAVSVESMGRDPEAAIGGAAIGLAVRPRYRHTPGTAVFARHQAHRYRADGSTTHHGQDDTAGAFHAAILLRPSPTFRHARMDEASKSQPFHGILRMSSVVSRRRKNAR